MASSGRSDRSSRQRLPRSFRAAWPYIVASLALLVVGFIAGWVAVDLRPDLRASLVPQSLFDEMARGQIGTGVQDAPIVGARYHPEQHPRRVDLLCGWHAARDSHGARAAHQRMDARDRGRRRSYRWLRLPVLVTDRAARHSRAQRDRDQWRDRSRCSATRSCVPGNYDEPKRSRAWRSERCCWPSVPPACSLSRAPSRHSCHPSSLPDGVKLADRSNGRHPALLVAAARGPDAAEAALAPVRPSSGNPRVDWS